MYVEYPTVSLKNSIMLMQLMLFKWIAPVYLSLRLYNTSLTWFKLLTMLFQSLKKYLHSLMHSDVLIEIQGHIHYPLVAEIQLKR